MAGSRSLQIVIGGDSAGATRALGNIESSLGKMQRGLGDVIKTAAGFALGFAFTQAPGILLDAAKAAATDAASQAKLQQAVQNTGVSWEKYGEQLNATIEAGIKKGFADDQQRDALALLMAQTGDAEEAQKRLVLAQDLARGSGMDLEAAARLLGKANEDNVDVLKRLGISMKEGATEADLFAAVQAKFGGQADAFAKSAAGSWEVFNLQMGELQEQLGTFLLPMFTQFGQIAQEAVGFASGLLEKVGSGDIGGALGELLGTVESIASDMGGRLMDAVQQIPWGEVWGAAQSAAGAVGGFVSGLLGDAVQLGIDLGGRLVAAAREIPFGDLWEAVKQKAADAGGFLAGLIGDAVTFGTDLGGRLITAVGSIPWGDLWERVKSVANDAGGFISGLIGDAAEFANTVWARLVNTFQNIDWTAVWASLRTAAGDILGFVTGLLGDAVELANALWARISHAVQQIEWESIWTHIQVGGAALQVEVEKLWAGLDWSAVGAVAAQAGSDELVIQLAAEFEKQDFTPVGEAIGAGVALALVGPMALVVAGIKGIFASEESSDTMSSGGISGLIDAWNKVQTSLAVAKAVKDTVAEIIDGFVSTFVDTFGDEFAAVTAAIEKAFRSITVTVGIFHLSNGNLSIDLSSALSVGASIEGRASGGPVYGGQPYMVGEQGPELFVPGSSGTIVPNSVTNNYNVTVNTRATSGTYLMDIETARAWA